MLSKVSLSSVTDVMHAHAVEQVTYAGTSVRNVLAERVPGMVVKTVIAALAGQRVQRKLETNGSAIRIMHAAVATTMRFATNSASVAACPPGQMRLLA
mmetsp:Transcript_14221/g.20850  ORF Transcript_14221/g.20850 Transcript_14221/m.20850 type:complete len:98 (-) Transcript_14221:630-923(-)